MNQTTNIGVLETKVAKFKLIARDSLRMGLVGPRLTRISSLEGELKQLDERKADHNHNIKVENYELSKLDTEHPNYDKKKASKEENVKYLTENLVNLDKEIEEVNKCIAEQREGIAKIESGETKVSLDSLNDLVAEMVRQDAIVQVVA